MCLGNPRFFFLRRQGYSDVVPPDAVDRWQRTPVHWVCARRPLASFWAAHPFGGSHPDRFAVVLVLGRGLDPGHCGTDHDGRTPGHSPPPPPCWPQAILNGHLACLRTLLELGADPTPVLVVKACPAPADLRPPAKSSSCKHMSGSVSSSSSSFILFPSFVFSDFGILWGMLGARLYSFWVINTGDLMWRTSVYDGSFF